MSLDTDLIYVSRVIPELKRVAAEHKDYGLTPEDGTGDAAALVSFNTIHDHVAPKILTNTATWANIAQYALSDARTERAPEPLRMKLAYTAAVCLAWIEDLEARGVVPAS